VWSYLAVYIDVSHVECYLLYIRLITAILGDVMPSQVKRYFISLLGFILVAIGVIFIILPGPAILFLPLGLALLSLEYDWAKVWLRRCQRWMRKGAVAIDKWISEVRYKKFR
jgi:hypothetical protein